MRKTELATLSHYADLYLFAQVLLLVKWAPFFLFLLFYYEERLSSNFINIRLTVGPEDNETIDGHSLNCRDICWPENLILPLC
jgi:hypothetical protein